MDAAACFLDWQRPQGTRMAALGIDPCYTAKLTHTKHMIPHRTPSRGGQRNVRISVDTRFP